MVDHVGADRAARKRAARKYLINQVPAEASTGTLLSTEDVAEHFKVHRTTIWRWVAEGILKPPLAMGARRYWTSTYIDEVVRAAEAKANGEVAA